MSSRYVLHEVCRGQYRFTLTSHKGQVLLTSGLFMDKESALRAINTIRHLARNSKNYDLRVAEDGGRYFMVVTRKGEALAYSATYPDAEGRQAAINLVKCFYPWGVASPRRSGPGCRRWHCSHRRLIPGHLPG